MILWRLYDQGLGFSGLMEAFPGISPKVLTERLAGFVERGLGLRSSTSTFPHRTVYVLADSGRRVSVMLKQIYKWCARDLCFRSDDRGRANERESRLIIAEGKPSTFVTERLVQDVFGLPSVIISDPVSNTPLIVPKGRRAAFPRGGLLLSGS
ncbi:hypothetical protein F3Y30_21625 (plasmid) [Sinorhizobium sp. BG8]|nr:hypothetical protein F3Y30_21625 [Sinorhizobium sp. BG8]